MATFHTNYTVARNINIDEHGHVALRENGKGGVDVIINGQKALTLTSTGYLRRHPVTTEVGFRLLDDGKIAMKVDLGSAA